MNEVIEKTYDLIDELDNSIIIKEILLYKKEITDNKERKCKNQIINRFKRIIVYWGYVGTFTGKILPLWLK